MQNLYRNIYFSKRIKPMYTVVKRMEVSAAHSLRLSYPSKCENLHGHNWIITVWCRSRELNEDGMVVDSLQSHGREHRPLGMRPDTCLLQGRGAGVRRKHGHL